jgi:hypothetical protein
LVSFPPNPKWQDAGGENMNQFGLLNVVDDLAKGDPLKWEAIMNLENSTVLAAMQMSATRAWVEYRMRQNDRK